MEPVRTEKQTKNYLMRGKVRETGRDWFWI